MRWSTSFIPTLRDDPADAEAASHRLMIRAGLVRQRNPFRGRTAMPGLPANGCGVEDLSDMAEASGANVHIVSGASEEGGILMNAFGGIVALLRYKLQV